MKLRITGPEIIIVVLASVLIILNLDDLRNVFINEGEYPFGSEFFSSYSIYSSKLSYVVYNIASTLVLSITIVASIRWDRKILLTCILGDIVLFLYPIFTNE